MPSSDSDSDSAWNKELITAVSKKQGKTKIISEEDRIKQIQECLNEDADIDTVDGNGNTALHTAVKRGYEMVAEFLRKTGARTDIPNRNGQTAISLARDLDKQDIMCTLNEPSTSRNSDLSSHNPSSNPPLNSTIRKRTAADQDSSFGESLSKTRLINAPQADPQRDVVSDEQRSHRKRTADNKLVEHTERLPKMTLTAKKETYGASGLKTSLHGTAYQLKHLMLIMHRARKLNYSFQLATEMNAAEKFDDVVLRYTDSDGDKRYRFLQVKHKQDEGKAISAKDLSNNKDGDFSLLKYFVSWRKIEKNSIFAESKSKDFILCTNIGLKVDDLKKINITVVKQPGTDNLLDLRDVTNRKKKPRRYKLSIQKTSSIWKTLKSRCEGKVTDKEISNFLGEFILAVNQPNEEELGRIIKREIGDEFNQLDAGIVRDSFQIEILDWFKTKDGTFLSDEDADEFFNKMKGELDAIKAMAVGLDHMEKLEELGIRFDGVNTIIQNFINRPPDGSKQLMEIISRKQTLLTALLVRQTLSNKKKGMFTFVRLETLSRKEISKLVLRAFEWSADQNLLIVDCESISAKQHLQSLWNPICKIMAKNVNKKMILITQAGEDLGSECCLDRETCRVDNTAHSFENLTNESQKKLLGKRVTKFQGTNNSTNLAELLDIADWDNLREDELKDLSNLMDTNSLIQLISEKELRIGRELHGLEDVGDYYVDRTIFRHVVIKDEILKDTGIRDILAMSGIDEILSGELMRMEGTSDMNDTLGVSSIKTRIPEKLLQIRELISTGQGLTNFITLARNQEEEQFNALCAKNNDRNVHWLKKEEGKYIWEKSQGNMTYLRHHRCDSETIDINDMTGVTSLKEDDLAAYNEPMIISDTAGMGKSTMLTSLASKMKKKEPDMLVLKIDLSDYSTALAEVKEIKSSYDLRCIDGVIQFLVMELLSGETYFSRKVFKEIIKRKRKVALIFDGFDEISPSYEQTVIDILQTLADYGIRKLLVATRPHTRGTLETKLNAFSFEIRPFSMEDQERFLTSFWKTKFEDSHHDLNPTAEDRIAKYTKAIMKTLADLIKDQRNNFTANPLQAKLVAEVFERHNEGFQEKFDSCKDFIDSEADEPKFPEKINLIYLYEHFMGKKFETFFKKRGGNLADVAVLEDKERRYKSYIARHEKLALKTLFDKDSVEELQVSQRDLNHESPHSTHFVERDGIITHIIDGQPRFGHRTYAEFLAARFFSNILKRREPDESFGRIFVAYVLLEDKYETMRSFINFLLADEYRDVLEGEFWTRFVKEHRSQEEETIFHLAAVEGNDRILRIFLNCFGANKEDRKAIIRVMDSADRTAVDRAVENGHLDIVKLLAEDTDFEINCQDKIGRTPLYHAAHMGTLDIVRYFIDKGADVKLQDINGDSPLHAAAYRGHWHIMKYLMEKNADITPRSGNGVTVLHVASAANRSFMFKPFAEIHDPKFRTYYAQTPLYTATLHDQSEMVKCFVEKGGDVNSRMIKGKTPLYTAARYSPPEMAKYLLENGADVNLPTIYGKTPLYTAARYGQSAMVKYLLEKGADVNSRTNDGETPLYIAAMFGKSEKVKYLLEKGADVNLRTNDGKTPLWIAALFAKSKSVKYLLEKGADVNSRTNDGQTPLYAAAQSRRSEGVKYLLEKGADVNLPNNDGNTPLYTAIWWNKWEIVKYLLEKGADVNLPNNYGDTPLSIAAQLGRAKMVKYLLEKGANINSLMNDGFTPLHAAACGGILAIIDCFLEKGADVDLRMNDGETPLFIAAENGHLEMVKHLLEKGANINSRTNDGSTLLHACVNKCTLSDCFCKEGADVNLPTNERKTPLFFTLYEGQLEVVKYLFEKGVNINSRTNDGLTLLHVAASRGSLAIVDWLLEKGANVDLPTDDGKTPLFIAAEYGRSHMVKYLLAKGANINSRTNDGLTLLHACGNVLDISDCFSEKGIDVNLPTNERKTPLFFTSYKSQLEVFEYLLEKGADSNSWTNDGLTLLHVAASKGLLAIVDCFLKKGANVDSPTNDGKTPLFIAAEYGRLHMVEYLLAKGANINSQSNEGWTVLDVATDKSRKDVVKYLLGMGATANFLPTHG